MNSSHTKILRAFEQRVAWLLMARTALRWSAVWFFVWGVVALILRITGSAGFDYLLLGLLGIIPVSLAAAWVEWRHRPSPSLLRATYDQHHRLGGMVMAQEQTDMAAWTGSLAAPAPPSLKWRSGKSLNLFAASALFVAVTLLIPDRFTSMASSRSLEIGQLVEELEAEVELLEEEKILEENKAIELKQQLAKLEEQSSGTDPSKTWEALDHLKEQNSDAAKQAAEDALSKLTSLTQAEALASALQMALEDGLGEDVASQAAQDLASLMKAANLEFGLLQGELPAGLLQSLASSLSPEDLEKLLKNIALNKGKLSESVGKLAKLKLIDAELLAKCKGAGQCPNVEGLAAFLKECEGGECNALAAAISYCRGGITRGRGDAPMTWTDPSSEEGVKFKEEVLPPSANFNDAQLVGVSRSAPQASSEELVPRHGALAGAPGGAGSAYSQAILPRHKKTVQQFFKREE